MLYPLTAQLLVRKYIPQMKDILTLSYLFNSYVNGCLIKTEFEEKLGINTR